MSVSINGVALRVCYACRSPLSRATLVMDIYSADKGPGSRLCPIGGSYLNYASSMDSKCALTLVRKATILTSITRFFPFKKRIYDTYFETICKIGMKY